MAVIDCYVKRLYRSSLGNHVSDYRITDKKYHPNEKWHLKKGSKATYVEYWYPYDVKNKKVMTWEEYREDLENGRNEKEFTLATRYTAVFNAHEVEGMPELSVEQHPEIKMDELVQKLSEGMEVEILTDGGDRAYYSPSQDKIHLPTPESFQSEYAFNATALHEEAHAFRTSNQIEQTTERIFRHRSVCL